MSETPLNTGEEHSPEPLSEPVYPATPITFEVAPPSAKPVTPAKAPFVLTDRLRKLTFAVLHPAGLVLHKLGIHPNSLTIIGTILVFVAAVVIGFGEYKAAAVVLLLALPFDALDGAVARAGNKTSKFGALLDSTLDRYADAAIFAGLGYHFARNGQFELVVLAFLALMGSFVVSYVRARAEGVGVDVKIGLFSRVERLVIILLMLFIPELLTIGLIVLAVGTNFTAVQRIVYVYRALSTTAK